VNGKEKMGVDVVVGVGVKRKGKKVRGWMDG
jgi:hypothetical protein